MEKEILTLQKIKSDFKSIFSQQVKKAVISFTFILLIIIIVLLPVFFAPLDNKLFIIIAASPVALALYATFSVFFSHYKSLNVVISEKFKIVTDRLTESHQEIPWVRYRLGKPNILTFNKYGKFIMPEGVNYCFSERFCMRDTELFRCSKVDDIFYLVIDSKKNILQIYNTKFFELLNYD